MTPSQTIRSATDRASEDAVESKPPPDRVPRGNLTVGPTFVAQFLNMQADGSGNPANHIHSGWRRLPADFGLELK